MKNTNSPYHFFGSVNSLDYDVVFFIEKMPETIANKLALSKKLSAQLVEKYPTKTINANLAVCENGQIIQVYKGTADELNNAILRTYHLHQQDFDNQITNVVKRDIHLKMIRCLRMLLSFISKTQYRTIVKQALKQDIYVKIEALKTIDFNTVEDFGKGSNALDLKKSMAFQLGQTLALYEDVELYSKQEIVTYFPELEPYLMRFPNTEIETIQQFVAQFIAILELEVPKMKITEELLNK
ncbi:hypothetical protein SY27_13570 [Flavobacterium sp. 316]|uniref:hypothetical protein n=1 Tax=Flavobacterium sp. 316 TaxID=1603293 RepID=UPI0005DD9EE8|nr:hypothetical protein [Flavobacterium sp. 316]KIX20175.1 hypothetical protein SY27_13570 [Flavobacterium sp. 316]